MNDASKLCFFNARSMLKEQTISGIHKIENVAEGKTLNESKRSKKRRITSNVFRIFTEASVFDAQTFYFSFSNPLL